MSNTDRSASARLRYQKSRTLAAYYLENEGRGEAGRLKSLDPSVRLVRSLGQQSYTTIGTLNPPMTTPACCACTDLGSVTGVSAMAQNFEAPLRWTFEVTWVPVTGATRYTLSVTQGTIVSTTFNGETSAILVVDYDFDSGDTYVRVTAQNDCGGTSGGIGQLVPCFLAGSQVAMADGTFKVIEDVKVGDMVLGAFGESNQVLALHRPLLGSNQMACINGEHKTSAHHPHIGAGKEFYCAANLPTMKSAYGTQQPVIDGEGNTVLRTLVGVEPERLQTMSVGVDLKTLGGSKKVRMIEIVYYPSDTQLYNLVVDGSHTYHVEGYAVTGWPDHTDFDYTTWCAKTSS